MKGLRIAGVVFFAILIFVAGIGGGIAYEKQINAKNSSNTIVVGADSKTDFQMMNDAWNLIHQNFVDQSAFTNQSLTYAAIAGMVDSLGDTGHSVFLTPAEVQKENDSEQGQYQGIGVTIQVKNGSVVVVAPIDGSPAQKAGIVAGDIILAVNGIKVTTAIEAADNIKGKAGTSLTVTILKADGTTSTLTLVRAVINVVNVTWNILPGTTIAHLRLSSFDAKTESELDKALAAIKAQGATAILLDLRNNPGGLLDQAEKVASRFLISGNVLLEKDIKGNIKQDPVLDNVPKNDLPLVVLINQGSASASEIVAGALQDAGRAKLVGEATFGTGTAVVSFNLADGSVVRLGVSEWLTPSGKSIWHTGLTPDTVVLLPTGVIPLFPEAETRDKMTMDQIQSSGDQQLLDAMGMLK
jgi:carboxyl-terminal processing protease